jgi:hypothetical protein
MRITNANLMRWAGLYALIGGLCYVFVGIFHPANALASDWPWPGWDMRS